MTFEMNLTTAFEVQIYFYAMVLMSIEVERKMLIIVQGVVNSTLAGVTTPLLQRAQDALRKAGSVRLLQAVKHV